MKNSKQKPGYSRVPAFVVVATVLYLTGCSITNQIVTEGYSTEYDLPPGSIQAQGLAFITPSAATGQETNRHALALGFSGVVRRHYPDARVTALPQLLSAVNRAGLAEEYTQMCIDYETTGILERESLHNIASVANVRYIGHLDLAKFEQSNNKRLGVLGLRLMETKKASIRVFLQIWDAQTANIVWEGSEELTFSYDTARERPVTFTTVVEAAADRLLERFPRGVRSDETRHMDLTAAAYELPLSN